MQLYKSVNKHQSIKRAVMYKTHNAIINLQCAAANVNFLPPIGLKLHTDLYIIHVLLLSVW